MDDLCSRTYVWLLTSIESTTFDPWEIFLPSHMHAMMSSSHHPIKTLKGPQTLSEHPPVKGKCTFLVHVIHVVSTLTLYLG